MMVYGSGPAPKEAFDPWAFWFLARGHAVLTWDKRGSGRSTGDFRLAELETLAADAVRVIERARRDHPKQTRRLIGWGASQGGWILPQLGAKGAIDGAILHAGSSMKPGDQILAAVEAELIAYEFSRDEIERALAFYRLDTDVSLGRAPWNAANEAYRAAVARGAEWLVAPLASKDAPERTMIRLMAEFDPAPFWRMNQAPTLAIFGSKDWTVPADANRQGLEALVPQGRRLRTVTLKDANHLMFLARTGYRTEYPSLSRLHPEYFPEIDAWLTAEGVPQGERAHERNASTVG